MIPLQLACLLSLSGSASLGEGAHAPCLTVLEGSVRVLAGETWLQLAPGSELPESRLTTILSLDWNVRARLTVAGAGIELRGPLEVESSMEDIWSLRIVGGGDARVNARSTPIHIDLASAARLDLARGAYWIESVPAGGWRIGCDAGDPLILRAPRGTNWGRAAQLQSGCSLRLIPTEDAPPTSTQAGRRLVAPAWASFSWPWPSA